MTTVKSKKGASPVQTVEILFFILYQMIRVKQEVSWLSKLLEDILTRSTTRIEPKYDNVKQPKSRTRSVDYRIVSKNTW